MELAITVNGTEIPRRDVELEAQNHPAASAEDALQAAAESLVIRHLLTARALELGIVAPEKPGSELSEEEAVIDALIEQEIDLPKADEETCKRYYEANPEQFVSPTEYEPFHILYSADADNEELYAKAVASAEAAIAILQEDPSAFSRMAQEESTCPSGKMDGSLGRVQQGQTVPEFETFMMSLDEDQLCPVPVKTQYGVHVIRLDKIFPGREIPYETVNHKIAEYLHEASWRQAASQYIKLLVGQAKISGLSIAGSESPLVQ